MRLGLFDLLGGIAVAWFAVVVGIDLNSLRSTPKEIDARVTVSGVPRGFRPGVSWFGVYLNDAKVGFIRLERRREHTGFSIRQNGVLDIVVLSTAQRFDIELRASLDPEFTLRHFDLALSSTDFDLKAAGRVADGEMNLAVTIGAIEDDVTFPIGDRPLLDIGVNALVLGRSPRIGDVIEFEVFDPLALKPRAVFVEYLGTEEVGVVDGSIRAHRLRRSIAGAALDVWVNDLGEVLREELPLGLVAVRETEAAATWGFRTLDERRAEPLAVPADLLGALGQPRDGVR